MNAFIAKYSEIIKKYYNAQGKNTQTIRSQWVLNMLNYYNKYKMVPDTPHFYANAPDFIESIAQCKKIPGSTIMPDEQQLEQNVYGILQIDKDFGGIDGLRNISGYLLVDYSIKPTDGMVIFLIPKDTPIISIAENAIILKDFALNVNNTGLSNSNFYKNGSDNITLPVINEQIEILNQKKFKDSIKNVEPFSCYELTIPYEEQNDNDAMQIYKIARTKNVRIDTPSVVYVPANQKRDEFTFFSLSSFDNSEALTINIGAKIARIIHNKFEGIILY